jgi:uncharacterized membrane protein YeiH
VTIAGTVKALDVGALVAIAMGAVTGSVGGIIRLGVGRLPAMIAGALLTFGVRSLAITFGWSVPVR